ncbi:hypothetical protein LJK87_31455 [Paenibacillus sp. P25]|nr:hypothetical protein LJK87_31455 [Paenibacillus sp. P25]
MLRLSQEHAAERRHRRRMKEARVQGAAGLGFRLRLRQAGKPYRPNLSRARADAQDHTGERYRSGAVERWLTLSVSAGVSFGFLGYFSSGDLKFAVFMGALVPGVRWMYTRLRLRHIQLQSGYDLAEAVGILAGKYKMTRGNMRTALRLAGPEITSPAIRRMFLHLIREEMNYVDPREMEKAIEELVYGIQTSFAKRLGLTLLKGLVRGSTSSAR